MIDRTEHTVILPHLPPELSGLRVAQLSDLHRSRMTSDRLLRHAVSLVEAACPDLILLTGDFVTLDPADIEPCSHILAPLHAPLGRFAVLGNHDYSAGAHRVEQMLTRLGIEVLNNRSVRLPCGLCLVGLEDDRHGHPDAERAFHGIREDEPTLALIHNPAVTEMISHRDCIAFSGHTHGGQVRLPYITAREVRRIGAKHYREGWYDVGRVRLYVNRGLGKVGVPLRFLCRPEVSLFTLLSAAPA